MVVIGCIDRRGPSYPFTKCSKLNAFHRIRCHVLICLAVIGCAPVIGQEPKIDFSRDVQPILSENCYYCHGQDGEQRQAGLRLDRKDDAHAVIESGDADNSDLYLRMMSDDPDELMPPPDSNRELTPAQKQIIKRWINQGAQWQQHWAFRPIQREMPQAKSAIDYYVSKTLKQNSLSFSPRASKPALIRRVSLDLTGLPPTIKQIDKYLNDDSPNAYRKMVDRFLASPAYGERMAWVWLDAARYADSNGYQGDNERTMWPWRDWVVNSYNDNMPFDQFSKWQIAGDLYPNATREQKLATGFNRNHPINGEGGRIAEENRIDYVMDMAETTGTVWMGLTFNCCRCHDHKYDQLTQEDYYSLFAFFNQTPVTGRDKAGQSAPLLAIASESELDEQKKLESKIAAAQKKLKSREKEIADQQSEWESTQSELVSKATSWKLLPPEIFSAKNSYLKKLKDDSLLTHGPNPDKDIYEIAGTTNLKSITGLRLQTLPHPTMTNGGLARSDSSNFVLTDVQVFVVREEQEPEKVSISSAFADLEQGVHKVNRAIDDDSKTGWAVLEKGKMKETREAILVFENEVSVPANAKIQIVLKHESQYQKHNIGRFKLALTDSQKLSFESLDEATLTAFRVEPDDRTPEQAKLIRARFHNSDGQYVSIRKSVRGFTSKRDSLAKSFPRVMVMADMDSPRKTFRLDRGSYEQPLNEVTARIPTIFGETFEAGAEKQPDRLALANWIFSESNPLTPRVSINRIWAQFFGVGLVKTTEDFGVQGEPPSHPELLDWLAAEYQESGWDTKHMIRLILNSQAYQQASKTNEKLLSVDPENRLLARSPRYRMPAWMLRDHALAASGSLVRDVGGKPVNPYQPGGVWEEASFGKKKFKLGTGDELYRRSLYTFWRRIAAPTMFFDNADRMTCSVKKYLTNTPLHALNTLNDVTFVESARILASDVIGSGKDDQSRLNLIFRRVISRSPDDQESKILLAGLKRTQSQFKNDISAAKAFIELGATAADEKLDPVELASWTSLCLAILNLDEALTRQ